MPRKRYKAEEIVAKLRRVDVLVSQRQVMAHAIRQIGVSEVAYYRWRQEFGGLKIEQVKRLKELELENSRLRKAVSDLTLDKLILQEAAGGGFIGRSFIQRTDPNGFVNSAFDEASPSIQFGRHLHRYSGGQWTHVQVRHHPRPGRSCLKG
jgi:putative transposase